MIRLDTLDSAGIAWAQGLVVQNHYLHRPVDPRCSVEGYGVRVGALEHCGTLLVGRPQATRCYPWYGSVEDVAAGRAEVTRWQVLNLARVYFYPHVQPGGYLHDQVPGFRDRRGVWRSRLGSVAIGQLAERVGLDYLLARPPCFLDEPYELRWLLSYCDTRVHRGALYRACGFELYRTGPIQTWRLPLRSLSQAERAQVEHAAQVNGRSRAHRARRAQLALDLDLPHGAPA